MFQIASIFLVHVFQYMFFKSCKSIFRNQAIMFLTRPYMDYVTICVKQEFNDTKLWLQKFGLRDPLSYSSAAILWRLAIQSLACRNPLYLCLCNQSTYMYHIRPVSIFKWCMKLPVYIIVKRSYKNGFRCLKYAYQYINSYPLFNFSAVVWN